MCVVVACVLRAYRDLPMPHVSADLATLYANWRIKGNSPRHVILKDLGNVWFVQHSNIVMADDSTHLPRGWSQIQCPITLCPMFCGLRMMLLFL